MAFLAGCHAQGAVLWDSASASVLPSAQISTGASVNSLQFFGGKPIVALGSADGVVQLHMVSSAGSSYVGSLPTGEPGASQKTMGAVSVVRFSSNNRLMAVGSRDAAVYCWDLRAQVRRGC
jgi:WD40 repeat protein